MAKDKEVVVGKIEFSKEDVSRIQTEMEVIRRLSEVNHKEMVNTLKTIRDMLTDVVNKQKPVEEVWDYVDACWRVLSE